MPEQLTGWRKALSLLWHTPGRTWAGMMKAAPVTIWQRFGAALVVSAGLALTIWINWRGPWPEESWKTRLDWNGTVSVMLVLALIICVVALFDFRVKLKASRTDGLSMEADGDHPEPPKEP